MILWLTGIVLWLVLVFVLLSVLGLSRKYDDETLAGSDQKQSE
jgi:hypothetical protein